MTSRLLSLVAIAAAPTLAHGQATSRMSPSAAVPVVVYRFTSDLGHQDLASDVARMLVRALRADPAFRVMTHPRAAAGGENARYAVIGHVSGANGTRRVAVQLLEIDRVLVVARDTVDVTTAAGTAQHIAQRLRGRLGPRAAGRAL